MVALGIVMNAVKNLITSPDWCGAAAGRICATGSGFSTITIREEHSDQSTLLLSGAAACAHYRCEQQCACIVPNPALLAGYAYLLVISSSWAPSHATQPVRLGNQRRQTPQGIHARAWRCSACKAANVSRVRTCRMCWMGPWPSSCGGPWALHFPATTGILLWVPRCAPRSLPCSRSPDAHQWQMQLSTD